jgi:hypothetical protein
MKPADDQRKFDQHTRTSLASVQTANESFISLWNKDVQQQAPKASAELLPSSHMLDCDDRQLCRNFDVAMVFAYESLKKTEKLEGPNGSALRRNDIAARLANFCNVRSAVEKENKEKMAKQIADAEDARQKRMERKTQTSDRRRRKTLQEWKECFQAVSFDKFKSETTLPEVTRSVVTVLPVEVEDQATVKFIAELMQGPRRVLRCGKTTPTDAEAAQQQAELNWKKAARAQKRRAKGR